MQAIARCPVETRCFTCAEGIRQSAEGGDLPAAQERLDAKPARIDTMWARIKIGLIGSVGELGRSIARVRVKIGRPGTEPGEIERQGAQSLGHTPPLNSRGKPPVSLCSRPR